MLGILDDHTRRFTPAEVDALRRHFRMTYEELAEKAEIPLTTLQYYVSGTVARLYAGGITVGEARIDDTGIIVGLFERKFGDRLDVMDTLNERLLPVINANIAEASIELLIAAYTREITDEDGNYGKATFDCDGLRLTGKRYETLERWLAGFEVPIVAEYQIELSEIGY